MKALILAAGRGSRLEQFTQDLPKTLMRVGNKPILQWQVASLLENGVDEIGVVIGYQAEKVKVFLKEVFPGRTFHFFMNHSFLETNSAYSFLLAKDFVSGSDYLHLNCDIVYSKNLVRDLLEDQRPDLILTNPDTILTDNMEQVQLEGDKIVKMDNQKYPEAVCKAYGVAKISAESVARLLFLAKCDIEEGKRKANFYGLLRKLVLERDFCIVPCGKYFLQEVNTVRDLEVVQKRLDQEQYV